MLASPSSSGERLAQLQLLLAARSSDIDVFLIDTTWPGMLADFFVDLYSDRRVHGAAPSFFPAFLKNNVSSGRLIALPWFIDAGVLYYRKDLLAKYGERPPETWTELTRIAEKVQQGERRAGNARFWGYVFQGRAYEGLTCNALEWIESWGGGSLVDSSRSVTIENPGTIESLRLAASWVDRISPRGVLGYTEEDSRAVFQSGDAAFLRNWPYVWKLANAEDSPVRGKVGMAKLPRGEGKAARHASVLGGWSLAVSRYSRHVPEAIGLVLYLTGAEEQKRRARILGHHPTLPALYRDRALLAVNPELPTFLKIFETSVARPSAVIGPKYNRVSSEFWDAVHGILSRRVSPQEGIERLDERLKFLSRGGKW